VANNLQLSVPGTYRVGAPTVCISFFRPTLKILPTKQHPRRLAVGGSDGVDYSFLLKGHEDLRQDERVMQLFGLVNTFLAIDRATAKIELGIVRYAVIPLSPNSGLIQWVPACDTVHAVIKTVGHTFERTRSHAHTRAHARSCTSTHARTKLALTLARTHLSALMRRALAHFPLPPLLSLNCFPTCSVSRRSRDHAEHRAASDDQDGSRLPAPESDPESGGLRVAAAEHQRTRPAQGSLQAEISVGLSLDLDLDLAAPPIATCRCCWWPGADTGT